MRSVSVSTWNNIGAVFGTDAYDYLCCIDHGKLLADQCHLWLQQV